MITHLAVRNFQSLRKIDLDLGNFTVIVGPSSSGKSALIRAVRALATNVRGNGMITRGQKQMAVTGTLDNGVKITLERDDRAGAYRLSGDGHHHFTKLGGEVPDKITQALRLDPINFAAQFDKPFLLDESGASVARILGELTNVNTIFEAVRQANRVRANAQSNLKNRRADLSAVRTRMAAYLGLPEHLAAFAQAEKADQRRRNLVARIGRLETAMRTLRIGEAALAKANPPQLPDTADFEPLLRRVSDLQRKLSDLDALRRRAYETQKYVDLNTNQAYVLKSRLDALLAEAGVCPTCGQQVH